MGLYDTAARTAMYVFYGTDMADAMIYNGVSILGHIQFAEDPSPQHPAATRAEAIVEVLKSDVSHPKPYDLIVIDNESWTVVHIVDGSRYDWKLLVERDVRKSGKGR